MLYYITIATKPHPVLEKLIEKTNRNNETIEVLGLQENRQIGWENQQRFGVKLREVSDYLKQPHLLPSDIVLFTDAYDVAYFGNQKEIMERYKRFNSPIVFGCEKECHPDPSKSALYKVKDKEFSYLNSGMFIGTVDALRSCMNNYNYVDTDDDQRFWTARFFDYPHLIKLDYENSLFLNTSNYDEKFFIFDIESSLAFYKHTNPLFVHVNGPDKSFINKLVSINPDLKDNNFDIVIPVGPNDVSIINDQIKHTKKNIIGYRNIYLLSYDPTIKIPGCITIDESIFPFSKKTIEKYFGKLSRNGWYLQQLLKLYTWKIIPGLLDRYLCIDADTFFVKPIEFIDKSSNKPYLCFGDDNHEEYFNHMKRMHPSFHRVDEEKSGICHHMMFDKKYLQEIFNMIETNHNNIPFYQVFLDCINPKDAPLSASSEFEIYFNYVLKFYRNEIELRKLVWEDIINWVTIIDYDGLIKKGVPNLNHDFVSYHHHLRKGNQWRETKETSGEEYIHYMNTIKDSDKVKKFIVN